MSHQSLRRPRPPVSLVTEQELQREENRIPCPLDLMMMLQLVTLSSSFSSHPQDFTPWILSDNEEQISEARSRSLPTDTYSTTTATGGELGGVSTVPAAGIATSRHRRLQEISSTPMSNEASVNLPFPASDLMCLQTIFRQQPQLIVSSKCTDALTQLHDLRGHVSDAAFDVILIGLLVLFNFIVFFTRLWSLVRARRKQIAFGERILRVVYSRPWIKQAVEEELGATVGRDPPIPLHRLRPRSPLVSRKRKIRAVLFGALF